MSICGIYKIEEKSSGKCYIGQSIDIFRRLKEHQECQLDDWHQNFHNSPENFSFNILETCTPNLLNAREKYWINYYDSYHNGLNKTSGNNSKYEIIINSDIIYYINFDFSQEDCTRLIKMIETPSFQETIQKLIKLYNINYTEIKYWFARSYNEQEFYLLKVMPFIEKECKSENIIYLVVDLSKNKKIDKDKDLLLRKIILEYCQYNSNASYHSFHYIRNIVGYKCNCYYRINLNKYYGIHKLNDNKSDNIEYFYLNL